MRKISIQCVVVLYKCSWDESSTVRALGEFSRQMPLEAEHFSLLLYDNSPEALTPQVEGWRFAEVGYIHDAENGGVAAAYNRALAHAQESNAGWLLLLDQDSSPAPAFFLELRETIAKGVAAEVCGIVPKLFREGVMLSPQEVRRFHNVAIPVSFSGLYPRRVTALNSAACLRVEAVAAAGGFAREYWLDFLDHVMFYRLQDGVGRVLLLENGMEHTMAIESLEKEMSLERYANLLAAEWRFVRETGSGGGPFFHRLRLLKRSLGHMLRLKNKRYAMDTLRAAVK